MNNLFKGGPPLYRPLLSQPYSAGSLRFPLFLLHFEEGKGQGEKERPQVGIILLNSCFGRNYIPLLL